MKNKNRFIFYSYIIYRRNKNNQNCVQAHSNSLRAVKMMEQNPYDSALTRLNPVYSEKQIDTNRVIGDNRLFFLIV